MKGKRLVDVGLDMMGDEQEISITLCDDDDIWHVFSYTERATVILNDMKVELVVGPFAPFYRLTHDELITFVRKYSKAPKDLVDKTKELRRQNMQKAREARKTK